MIGNSRAAKIPLLFLSLGLLASCGRQTEPVKQAQTAQPQSPQSEVDEVHALVQAVKDNPSVKDPKQAGPPIHVDPYPKSAGAPPGAHMPINYVTR
jgi:hypothetical protein